MESRTYEGLFLLDPTQVNQSSDWEGVKNQVVAMLEKRQGQVINARKWGERKLAYEINGHKRGTYLLVYFEMPTDNLSVLQRDLQLSELVMRNLILVYKRPVEQHDDDEYSDPEDEEKSEGETTEEGASDEEEKEDTADTDSQEQS